MQSHKTLVIYILHMMKRHRKAGSVDGCCPVSHIHNPLVTETFLPLAVFAIKGFHSFTNFHTAPIALLYPFCFSFSFVHLCLPMPCPLVPHSLFLFLFSFLWVCRIWWMISAKSSSWRWAIWMEARSTEHELEGACRSGAAESLLLEHTGVEMHAHTASHNSC